MNPGPQALRGELASGNSGFRWSTCTTRQCADRQCSSSSELSCRILTFTRCDNPLGAVEVPEALWETPGTFWKIWGRRGRPAAFVRNPGNVEWDPPGGVMGAQKRVVVMGIPVGITVCSYLLSVMVVEQMSVRTSCVCNASFYRCCVAPLL